MKLTSKAAQGKSGGKTKSTKIARPGNKQPGKGLPKGQVLYRNMLDNMLEGCQILDYDWRYLYLNATAEIHNQRPNQELLDNTYMEMWPGIESTYVFSEIKRCMEERVAIQLENRFDYPNGAIGWFNLSIQPIPEGVLILSLDITEYKRAEKQTTQLNRLYATLSQVNQMIVRVKNREDLYQSICDIAVQYGKFPLAWIGLLDEVSGEIKPAVANGLDIERWPFPTINIQHGDLQNSLVASAIRTSQVVTSEDIQTDQRTQGLGAQIESYSYHSSASVPFRLRGKTIGVVSMISEEVGFFKVAVEAHLLEEMGLDISFALDAMETEAKRKQAEENLNISEIRYRRLFESAKDGILILDAETGMIVDVNPFLVTLLGYSKEALLGKNIWELGFFKDIIANKANFLELQQREYIRYEDLPLETAQGRRINVEFVSNVYQANQQKVIQCNIRDITERRQAEAQIQRQLKYLSALRMIDIAISSSFDLNVILDVVLHQVLSQLGVDASALLLFNAQMQTIEYAASRGFRPDAHHHIQLKLEEGYASQAVLARKTIHISTLMETDSKLAKVLQLANESFVDYYGTPLIVKGEVKGVLEIYHRSRLKAEDEWLEFLETLAGQAAIAIDNAQLFENLQRSNFNLERRVAERTRELNRTNVELEYANRAKDEFLANMSHELRTPLTSILGMSESLLEERRGSLNDHQQKSLQIIESSGQHLLQLINDILDLSKIEAGKFDFYPQPISVDEVCRSSLSFVKSQALKKSITVTYIQDISISRIFADPRRLKQILVNLLSNAVKFTSENGEVILQVNADVEQDLIKFSVLDNGIGIAVEDLRRLFQPFVQVDSSLNRQHEGTGLGLALVQKLTDLHGGSVQVESEVGKGSRFTVNLPCLQEEIAKLEKLESQSTHRIKDRAENTEIPKEATLPLPEAPLPPSVILLADDNMPSILTIGEYLESHGYEVVVAHDGLEAVEKAEAIHPDLILMDIQMPVMNGLEAIARLRGNPLFAETPMITLTALAMHGDRERSLLAGANEYMSKPVSLRTLHQKIEDLLQGRSKSR